MKKLTRAIALILTLGLLLSATSLLTISAAGFENYYAPADSLFGDADGDGKLSVKDATAVQKYLAKMIDLKRQAQLVADVDGNSKLSISDATDIQKYLANIIDCFDASPTLVCEADGEAVRVEVEMESSVYCTVKIPKTGYYRFMTRRISGGTCYFRIYDGKEIARYTDSDSSVAETYAYLSAGKYRVELGSSYMADVDVNEFSVTSAEDKQPFDASRVTTLKPGDKIDVKAGEGTKVFKVDPKNIDDFYDGHIVYTEGAETKVTMYEYDKYMDGYEISDSAEEGVNALASLCFNRGENSPWSYLVVTQEEGGSDYTLICEGYIDYKLSLSEKITSPYSGDIKLELQPEGIYSGGKEYALTPEESGYYKLSVEVDDMLYAYGTGMGESLENKFSDRGAFNTVLTKDDGSVTCIDYLEEGKTYYVFPYVFSETDDTANLSITSATEEEFAKWDEEFQQQLDEWYGWMDETADLTDYTEIKLNEEAYVSLLGWEQTENYEDDVKLFKFTATEDMTVVAYSRDSECSSMTVYDENGGHLGHYSESGSLSCDFTVYGTLKAGESCYFELTTYGYYGDAFYFSVVDVNDYQPIK